MAPGNDAPPLEEHLAQVIRLARNVAATAEEMLRELALQQQKDGAVAQPTIEEALQPLQATRLQLYSAIELLRPH